ncbi:MAG: L,D-transpeptidase family protein [Brotaphodocola sp.]
MKWSNIAGSFVISLAFSALAAGTALAEDMTFVPGTSVNGLGISNMTAEEAAAHISNFYSSEYELKILERGGTFETINGTEIDFQVTLPEGFLQEVLDKQNESGRVFGPDADNKYTVDMQSSYNTEALISEIQGLRCITNAGSKPTSDAHLSEYQEGKDFVIVPEVRGNSADTEKIASLVQHAVESGSRELDLEAQGCYINPQVLSSDESLKEACNFLNQRKNMKITYEFDEESDEEILDWGTMASWVTGVEDGKLALDREKAAVYVKNLAAIHDTAYTERVFTTVDGREIALTGPYGWRINQSAETDSLIRVIQNGESENRTPIYATTGVSRNNPEWGNTYAEVNLTGQHVYMIQDGTVVWDAPCVTGNIKKGYGTPSGLYSLTYKDTDCVLRGEKRADGSYEYESPVSYWMPFNGGIGFHDASWRGNFGGTIYQTNGSHGCINLPPSQAQGLYDRVYKGMPVICYE